jgi:hypothetical protein
VCGTWCIIKTLFFIFLKKLHEKEADSVSPFGSLENTRENIAKAKTKDSKMLLCFSHSFAFTKKKMKNTIKPCLGVLVLSKVQ